MIIEDEFFSRSLSLLSIEYLKNGQMKKNNYLPSSPHLEINR